jgi:hypothetical protein
LKPFVISTYIALILYLNIREIKNDSGYFGTGGSLCIIFSSTPVLASLSNSSSSETTDLSTSDAVPKCVIFNSEERMIIINCKNTNLTQIESQLKDPDVLHRDAYFDKGWVLNAGITVAENAVLYINSSDTSWLKIVADGETTYPIYVSGSLKINSVGISSWNPNTNNYTSSLDSHRNGEDVHIGTPQALL